MFLKMWLLPLLIATSALASPSPAPVPTPQYSSPEPPHSGGGGGYYPSSSQRPVYTAQRNRDREESSEDDEPYPSTSNLGTAQTSHGAEEPENTGFVEAIDFKTLLSGVGSSPKALDLGASSSNPLFASESKNSFAGFFGSNNKDPFADFGGGGLATASSDRSSKSPSSEDDTGFVDPDVQFRSLFDSSQTANNGFKPEDFLGNKGDSNGAEPSKGSQTRTFPSFTYSGRKDDDYNGGSNNPRYRSSYRQVESQDDDYNNSPRNRDDDRSDDGPSNYNDRDGGRGYGGGYGSGEEDDAPQRGGPPSSSPRYNQGPRYSPATQETSHRPQSTGRGPKASESKNPKCKKVEKSVDYNSGGDDGASFTEPEADYDPSTYRGRYKRQSRQGRQSRGGSKRPMTCYVCEDEQGRYAEKCSYDSKANPNKGEYFHSTSSAYSDNGNRRPSGKTDRHRRNPNANRNQQNAEASVTTLSSVSPASPQESSSSSKDTKEQPRHEIEESEPNKVIEKRQSGGDRYASNFGIEDNNRGQQGGGNRNNNNNFDFENGGEYGLPRGYIGNNGGRVEGFESPTVRSSTDNSPASTGSGGQRGTQGGDNYGFTGNDNNRDFDFGNGREFNDFNFGTPSDFGREASPSGREGGNNGGQGFNFDFSIPRDYDPDVQLRGQEGQGRSNSNGRPNLDGSASSNRDSFPVNFDVGYDDYVKEYFPEAFGSGGSSNGPSSSPSYSPSSGPSISSSPPAPSYRPRGHSREHSFNQHDARPHHSNRGPSSGSPDKEHTQPSHNFAPPPNFFGNEDQGGFENTQNLHKLMDNFSGKDRSGCQKVQKGDMSCYVCGDARGMKKEECMYASNDPKNTRMAYHEVSEYSSDPPASILPLPRPDSHGQGSSHGPLHQSGSSPVASSLSHKSVSSPSPPGILSTTAKSASKPLVKAGSVTHVESKVVSTKILHEDKSPVEYDFDY